MIFYYMNLNLSELFINSQVDTNLGRTPDIQS